MKDLTIVMYLNHWIKKKEKERINVPPTSSSCLIGLYNMQVTLVKMVNEATANIPNWGS